MATFMETLHLTYGEVMDGIPYRNLVIMQKDKLHVCYGDKMVEVTDEQMFGKGAFKKG
ncbi:MAG: hypothetical protein LUC33_00315 [Prevotellaceae bacterium]|nr:hypothetical protein [Prevotellaceae bacterium]